MEYTLNHYNEARKHGRKIADLVAVAVTEHYGSGLNNGDYTSGVTLLVNKRTNKVIGGRFWTVSDFNYCQVCGHYSQHGDCHELGVDVADGLRTTYEIGTDPESEELLTWGRNGYGLFSPVSK